jgi:hypothetical protein
LIVFAHGFALVPGTYSALLDAWARAGYVVAAPIFPLTNADAPSGPNESDLKNQPRDVRFVISRLVALSAGSQGVLAGTIDSGRIAVAGQSDGGVTALAVARILQRAGAVRAMQFDINPEWPTLITYTHHHGIAPTEVVPNPMQPPTRYLVPDDRDFVAVYRRLPGPIDVPFK